MMTTMLRVLLIVVSIFTMVMMVKKIRQAKVQIEDSIFWLLLSFLLVIFSLFPANFLFLFTIFLLLVKLFTMSLRISQLEAKLKELTQKLALDELERQENRQKDGKDRKEI